MKYNEIFKNGYGEESLPADFDYVTEINKLKKEKNAIILGHYYQIPEVQNISDYLGDSLALAQAAEKTDADIIIFAGVSFMAETAKILNPTKKVIIPDLNAGCSLSDSCPPDEFEKFVKKHPNHTVITYVNSSTKVKALSDIICTSSNAVKMVNSLPKDEKVLFAPDKNLGSYIQKITKREMVIWDGACHVHKQFSLPRIVELMKQYPEAELIAHPECPNEILIISAFVGSTSALLNYVSTSKKQQFIVATESGILHQMNLKNPEKHLIPAPPEDSTCGCNDCSFMKLITLKKIYLSLKYELPEIEIPEDLRIKALIPLKRMLDLSI
ncbi:MAG: quinolinate synthase NadA [Salinivirgaceae bacterium]|nr:quinolinate synthase NadA [Salinivirgaceae bacterium]